MMIAGELHVFFFFHGWAQRSARFCFWTSLEKHRNGMGKESTYKGQKTGRHANAYISFFTFTSAQDGLRLRW